MIGKFRTDREMGDANERDTLVDRAWEATRPPGLAPAEVERIWLEVARACEQPATLSIDFAQRQRSGRLKLAGLVVFGLAQAAAVVIALMVTVRPDPKHAPQLPGPVASNHDAPQPPARAIETTLHEVDPNEELMLSFDEKGSMVSEKRIKPSDPPGATIVYLDLPASTQSDALGKMEMLSP